VQLVRKEKGAQSFRVLFLVVVFVQQTRCGAPSRRGHVCISGHPPGHHGLELVWIRGLQSTPHPRSFHPCSSLDGPVDLQPKRLARHRPSHRSLDGSSPGGQLPLWHAIVILSFHTGVAIPE